MIEKINETKEMTKLLDVNCSNQDILKAIILQINNLQKDILELEELKGNFANFLTQTQYALVKNSHVLDNKLKVFSTFYSTLLSYKKELNELILKLRLLLQDNNQDDLYKEAIKNILSECSNLQNVIKDNEEKMQECLDKNPNFMPDKF